MKNNFLATSRKNIDKTGELERSLSDVFIDGNDDWLVVKYLSFSWFFLRVIFF
jgi:hypothetical protein